MMIEEFTERTGIRPTYDEYREIENEYMGCDEDKDTFCKRWKKQGGVQRILSLRARRIEELEKQVMFLEKDLDKKEQLFGYEKVGLEEALKSYKNKLTIKEYEISELKKEQEENAIKLNAIAELFKAFGVSVN